MVGCHTYTCLMYDFSRDRALGTLSRDANISYVKWCLQLVWIWAGFIQGYLGC